MRHVLSFPKTVAGHGSDKWRMRCTTTSTGLMLLILAKTCSLLKPTGNMESEIKWWRANRVLNSDSNCELHNYIVWSPLGREHVLIMYTVWHSLLEVSLITSNCCCVVSSLNFIIFISWFRWRVSSPFYTVWFFIMNRVYPKWQRQKKTFVFSVNFNHNWKRRTMYCMNCS